MVLNMARLSAGLIILFMLLVGVPCLAAGADSDPCDQHLGSRDSAWYRESVHLVGDWRRSHAHGLLTVGMEDVAALARWVDLLRWEGCINPAGMADLPHQIRWAVRDLAIVVGKGDQTAATAAAADCIRRLEAVSARWYADGTPDGSGPWCPVTGWNSYSATGGEITLTCATTDARLTVPLTISAFAGGSWRIRTARSGLFAPQRLTGQAITVTRDAADDDVVLSIPGSRLELHRNPLRVMLSAGGQVLWDQQGLAVLPGPDGVIAASRLVVALNPDDRFLGGGERFAAVEQRGRVLTHWATDAILSSLDQIWSEAYKPVPWLVNPRGLGIFFNTTAQARFDLGARDPQQASFSLAGPLCDLFLFAAPPREALARYCQLTGPIVRPPAWAFAPWMGAGTETWNSRGKDHAADYVKEVAERMVHDDLPYAVLYTEGVTNHQPADRDLLDWLRSRQVHALDWYGPNGDPQREMRDQVPSTDLTRFFLHRTDGSLFRVANGRFLAGESYIDFTRPDIGDYLDQRWGWHLDAGISGNMIDGAEEVPPDAVAANGMSGTELHNAYGYFYDRAMADLFHRHRGDDYVLIARSGGVGRQLACHFAGDLPGSFDGLAAAVHAGMTAGSSALTMWGSDIGGYYESGGPLSREVFMRWTAFGTFSPLMRVHGQKPHFPWLWDDETLGVYRRMSWIRQALRPYLESCADACHRDGAPFMAPLAFGYPAERGLWSLGDEYLLGDSLVVAPVVTPSNHRSVVLPPGDWYELLDGFKLRRGPGTVEMDVPYDRIPVFLAGGSILPLLGEPKTLDLGTHFNGAGTPWLVVTPDGTGSCRPRSLADHATASVTGWRLRVTGPTTYLVLVVTATGARDGGSVDAGHDCLLQ
jgi:alpha-D-xyloside xylohydrolase